MKVVCAWCNGHLKGNEDDEHVSHGMCKACADTFSAAVEAEDREEVLQPA